MNLFDGINGNTYEITGISGGGQLKRRLIDLGFVKGTEIRICNIAPFKATALVALRGYMLAVRRGTGELINVKEITAKDNSL